MNKIKLNHNCIFCNKNIFLGERIILKPKPFHFDCYLKELNDKIISRINIIPIYIIKKENEYKRTPEEIKNICIGVIDEIFNEEPSHSS